MRQWLRQNLPLLLVLYLALILRIPQLGGSFWLDEAAQALEADRPFSQQLQIVDDFQPPLLHLLTFGAIQINRSELWLRLLGAVIPSLFTIWGTYELGRKLVSKKVGLLAALLLATNSFFIFFSQELRPYSLSAVFAVWSWFFLLEAKAIGQDSYQLKKKNVLNKFFQLFPVSRDFFLFLLMSILGLYSSYLYPFVLASQIIFLLSKKDWSKAIYSAIIPTLTFLPWLPTFLQQLAAGQALRLNFPGWENVVSFSTFRAPALTFGKFLFGVLDLEVNLPYLILTAIFLLLVGLILFSHSRQFWRQNQKKIWLWCHFLITPFLLATLVSLFVPVIQPKRVIYLLPFLYLLLSFLILGSRQEWTKLKAKNWLLLLFLIGLNLFSTFSYYQDPTLQREDWRHALATLHYHLPTDRTIAVFAYADAFSPWLWYEQTYLNPFPTLSTGNYDTSQIERLDQVLLPVFNYDYVIVFDYLRSLTDSQNLLTEFLTDNHYSELKVFEYPNLGFIRIYIKPGVNSQECSGTATSS